MKLVTAYDIGDTVYGVRILERQATDLCDICDGTERVAIVGHEDRTVSCPNGYHIDGQVRVPGVLKVATIDLLTIGKVDASVRQMDQHRVYLPRVQEVRYMAWETGVESGTVWKEDSLYRTRAGAEAAVEREGATVIEGGDDR